MTGVNGALRSAAVFTPARSRNPFENRIAAPSARGTSGALGGSFGAPPALRSATVATAAPAIATAATASKIFGARGFVVAGALRGCSDFGASDSILGWSFSFIGWLTADLR
jgi:hypothetical protein